MLNFGTALYPLFRITVLVYVGLGIVLALSERRIIYLPHFPEPSRFEECNLFHGAEKITYEGARFHYKHVGDLSPESSRIVVMYHGNAGSACDRSIFAPSFELAGYSYLFVEYPGYADDPENGPAPRRSGLWPREGGPSKKRILENVLIIKAFLEEKGYKSIALVGESLGVGVAAYHASIAPPEKIIFLSPHYELKDLAGWIRFAYPLRLLMRENYTPGLWMKEVTAPVLFIRATDDEIVPRQSAERFYEALIEKGEVLRVEIPGTHNAIYEHPGLYESIEKFLAHKDR